MIPVMIVFGLVLGRWWWLALTVAALAWPLFLLANDILDFGTALIGAGGLAAANAGVGVLAHQGALHTSRYLHRHDPTVKSR